LLVRPCFRELLVLASVLSLPPGVPLHIRLCGCSHEVLLHTRLCGCSLGAPGLVRWCGCSHEFSQGCYWRWHSWELCCFSVPALYWLSFSFLCLYCAFLPCFHSLLHLWARESALAVSCTLYMLHRWSVAGGHLRRSKMVCHVRQARRVLSSLSTWSSRSGEVLMSSPQCRPE
jgi:hypothetical protein